MQRDENSDPQPRVVGGEAECTAGLGRRRLLGQGVGAAFLAAAGVALAGGHDSAAGAVTGDPIIVGQTTVGGDTTVQVPAFTIDGGLSSGPCLIVQNAGDGIRATGLGTAIFADSPTGGSAIPLRLAGGPPSMPPTAGTFAAGSLAVDAGHLWYCYQSGSGSASKWIQLSQAPSPPPLNLLPSPVRVYDSRVGFQPVSVQKGRLSTGQARDFDARTGTSIPESAAGVVVNVTATGTNGSGFLSLLPGGEGFNNTSTLNWYADAQTIANGAASRVQDASGFTNALTVYVGGPGSTDFLVDVVAYFF